MSDAANRTAHARDRGAQSSDAFTPQAILRIGWRRKWHIVLPAILLTAVAGWWIHRLPNRYRSEALLLVVPQRIAETFVRSTVATKANDRLQSVTQQILSRTELERIIHDFDLYPHERVSETMEEIVESMRERDIEIRPVKGDAFRLGFASENPELARRVAERLVSLFIVQTSADRATFVDGTDQFLETQLEAARANLVENETKLADYRRRHNGALPTQVEANVRGLHNTEMQLQVLAESLNRDRDRQLILERSLKDTNLSELIDAGSRATTGEPATLTAAEQLHRAEGSLKDLRSRLTDQHPDVVALQQTMVDLRKRAANETARSDSNEGSAADRLRRVRVDELREELSAVERQIAEKTAEEARLRSVLLNYQGRIEGAPTREAELAALTRDYDTLQQTYRTLLTKKQESAIAADLERQQVGAQFKVLDPARLPEQPFAPQRTRLYAVAALASVCAGLFLAFLAERLDRGMRTASDVHAALGLPVLAAIPRVSRPGARGRRVAVAVSAGMALAGSLAALAWRLWL